jgi:hypothetical protein
MTALEQITAHASPNEIDFGLSGKIDRELRRLPPHVRDLRYLSTSRLSVLSGLPR